MRNTFFLAAALIVATAMALLVMIGKDDFEVPGAKRPCARCTRSIRPLPFSTAPAA
jgi:hypothetical protein